MPLRNFRDRVSKLLDQTHAAAQTDIPAGAIRDQVRGRVLPPATSNSKGGVTLSDANPEPLGTADPGGGAAVSSGDHVHAHGDLPGGSLHAVATSGAAGFQSAADKAKEDSYPAISGLTTGDVLTALTSTTVGFAPPSGGGTIPALTPGDILYADASGTLVTLPIGIDGSTLHAEDFSGTFLPTWDILPPRGGAGGDLGSTYPDPLVTGLQGFPISTTDPVLGDTLVFDGTFYTPTAAGTGTVTSVDITPPADGLTFSGGPITTSGAITAALANDLAALEGLASTGLAARTGSDTWAQRAITGTTNRLSVANGSGAAGNPTLDIDSAYAGQTSIVTLGPVATGSWLATRIGLAFGGTNADLSATGGANQVVRQSTSGGALSVSALVAADIPALDSAKITTGEIPRSPLTTRGDLLTRDASTHARIAIGAAGKYVRSDGTDPSWQALAFADLAYSGLTTGQVLRATGAAAAGFGALDLANASAITGTLPVANGGSGTANSGNLAWPSGGGTAALLGAAQTFSANQTIAADLIVSGTSRRIVGDFSNASQALRLSFQSTTANANSTVSVLPNGTATTAAFSCYNASDPDNAGRIVLAASASAASFNTNFSGTGSALPLTFLISGTLAGTFGTDQSLALTKWLELTEITAPAAGAANTGRLYLEDNGSGKTRLMIKFNTGAAQQIAIQP